MTTDTETAAPKAHGWRGQLLQLAAIVLAVFLAKGAFAEPFYVPSGSMEPTLLIGDESVSYTHLTLPTRG